MLLPYHATLIAHVGFATATVLWNVSATGRMVYHRRAPRAFATIMALGALLLIPALIIAVSAASIVYGRAMQPVAWLWPFVTVLFALQAITALARRLVHPVFGVPVLAYDGIIAAVTLVRYVNSLGMAPPHSLLTLSAAQASALSVVGGTAALSQAAWFMVPIFSPALPSRSRVGRAVRAALVGGVTVATTLVVIELPGAVEAIRGYARYEHDVPQERPAGDFLFGLKVFPELRGAPPGVAIEDDLALADSLGVDAVSVIVDPEAARGRPLDSLARVLDDLSEDSTTIIVTLGYPRGARAALRASPAAYVASRLADVNRIARTLRPTILIPAYEPYGEGARVLGVRPPEFWIDYISRAADVVHHVNPHMKVGLSSASYGTRDSTLYAWAASRRAPVDVLGFSLMPGFDGVTALDTHMRIARRWMHTFPRPKAHWVWAAGGYPIAHGERSQALALRGVLSWATAQEEIQGVVITEAGDYDAQRGLRAPDGRLRAAWHEVAHTVRALRETASP